MNTETLVRLFTPLFTALAAGVTGWVAKHFPGLHVPSGDLAALMALGGASAAAAALHWLHKQSKLVKFSADADAIVDKLVARVKADAPAAVALDDIEDLLKAHTAQIVQTIGDAVHAPPSVEEVLKGLAEQITGAQGVVAPVVSIAPAPPVDPPPAA